MSKPPKKRAIRHKLRNGIAKDVRTPKYKERTVESKKTKARARTFDDFCVYCMFPRGEHAQECLLRGFGP